MDTHQFEIFGTSTKIILYFDPFQIWMCGCMSKYSFGRSKVWLEVKGSKKRSKIGFRSKYLGRSIEKVELIRARQTPVFQMELTIQFAFKGIGFHAHFLEPGFSLCF